MSETDDSGDIPQDAPRRGIGKVGWGVTLLLALVLGGGGFYTTYAGALEAVLHPARTADDHAGPDQAAPRFLELDPLMVSVGGNGSIRQLRFRAFLQLASGAGEGVPALQPRILDIFATYLRAVSVDRLEDPTSLLQLRAQLLRRVQLLVGPDVVDDLLIIDFVIA